MKNVITWFEIPVHDIGRAKAFYEKILGVELEEGGFGSDVMAFFPTEGEYVSGALVLGEHRRPTGDGTLVYFDGGDDLDEVLARVEDAGGRIHVPKTLITPEAGYFGLFFDSEGNRLGVHSMG